jgi:uncharacterized protein with GYD domain
MIEFEAQPKGGGFMATYVTLVKITPQGLKSVDELGKEWGEGAKRVAQMGIKTIGAYGLLGPYDMMFIYEAPDEKVAAIVPMSFSSGKIGGQTETWTAIPMEEFVKLTGRLKG